jgi:Flp pilus assembly protein TadB
MTRAALPSLLAGLLLGAAGIRLLTYRPPPRSRRSRRPAVRPIPDIPAASAVASRRFETPPRFKSVPWLRTGTRTAPAGTRGRALVNRPPVDQWPVDQSPVDQSPVDVAPADRRPVSPTLVNHTLAGRPARSRSALVDSAQLVAGLAATALVALLGGGWVSLAPPILVGLWITRARLREIRIRKARRAAQVEAAPAAVDLLAACLTAGLNGHLALLRVADRCPAALKPEFTLIAADLRVGRSPAVALRAAAERTGLAELRAAAGALNAAERWGAPAAEALAARSEALRSRLRLEAEAAAERAAVRLTFPLVLCFLPSFALLTVVPMLAGALRALGV